MTLKTKDILKILKLVKKSKKAKKRRSKHKKKINITTQQIAPSTLQPYEISRQPFNNTNNVQLENLRLNNQVLENKLKEPDSNIKAIEDKLNLAIGYNNINDKVNLTTSSISDIKNDNMELNEKLNRVITYGNNFIEDTKRKFNNHQLKIEDTKKKLDNQQTKQEQENAANLSAVFDNMDDDPFTNTNPLIPVETFSLRRPPEVEEIFSLRRPPEVEETKTETPSNTAADLETSLNTTDPSITTATKPNFTYEKIKGQPILRKLIKMIETKPSRPLTEVEKNILKPFYTTNNVKWASATKSTSAVKKQLQNFTL